METRKATMKMNHNIPPIPPYDRIEHSKFTATSAVLSIAGLALLLSAHYAPAAPGDQPAEEKPRSIIAVFRLDGPLTEVPPDDAPHMLVPPATSFTPLLAPS